MIDIRHAGNNHNHEYMLKNTKLFLLNIYENKLQSDSNNNKQQVHEYEVPTGIFLQTATFFAVEPDLGGGQLKDYRVFDALTASITTMVHILIAKMMTEIMILMTPKMMTCTTMMLIKTLEAGADVGNGGDVVGSSAREPFTSYLHNKEFFDVMMMMMHLHTKPL